MFSMDAEFYLGTNTQYCVSRYREKDILCANGYRTEVTDAWEWVLTLSGGTMADGGDEAMEENVLEEKVEKVN